MPQENAQHRVNDPGCREGMAGTGLSITTRHVCAMQTTRGGATEEGLQSQLYFMKLRGLKETALGYRASSGSWSFRAHQLHFVFFPR